MNGNASCCVQRGGLIRSHGGGSGGGSGGGVDYTISCSSDGINVGWNVFLFNRKCCQQSNSRHGRIDRSVPGVILAELRLQDVTLNYI